MRLVLTLGLALLAGASGAVAQGRAPRPVCAGQESADALASVGPRLDIRLASGRLAKLSGLHVPDPQDGSAAAAAWLMRRAGQALAVTATGPEDRWGRLPVRLVTRGEPRLDLAEGLVEEGLALVDPGEGATLCRPELLAVEATARERGLGLWADGRYKPAAADDRDGLSQRVGRFIVVEGRVRSVGERRQRTYLNFGRDGTRDLTITIPKRTWTSMVAKGASAASLRNARIRARGVLEHGRGPTIEVTAAEMIEILERGRERP
jgi:hypothetical protein